MFHKILSITKKVLFIAGIGMLLFFGIPLIKNIYTYHHVLHFHNAPFERIDGNKGELVGSWEGFFDYYPCGTHSRGHYYLTIDTPFYQIEYGYLDGRMITVNESYGRRYNYLKDDFHWLDWGRKMTPFNGYSKNIEVDEKYIYCLEKDSITQKIRYKFENDQLQLNLGVYSAGFHLEKIDDEHPDWRTPWQMPDLRTDMLNFKNAHYEWLSLLFVLRNKAMPHLPPISVNDEVIYESDIQ